MNKTMTTSSNTITMVALTAAKRVISVYDNMMNTVTDF